MENATYRNMKTPMHRMLFVVCDCLFPENAFYSILLGAFGACLEHVWRGRML